MNYTLKSIVISRCEDMLLVSQAVDTCLDAFEQACEPRPPKAEWFGTGPGQWDAWWVQTTGGRQCLMRNVAYTVDSTGGWLETKDECWKVMYVAGVIPVAKEGYPAPVGWQVVGE